MGSKGGQTSATSGTTISNSSTSGTSRGASSTTPDPLASLAYQQTLQNAAQIANTPFQPYQGQRVAGFTPDQIAAQQGIRDVQGIQTPYINQAASLYEKAMSAAQNPNMAQAGDWYKKSFEYIENPNMQEARNLYAQAAQAAKNGQLDVAAKYTQDAINLSNIENFNQQNLSRYMNPYQQSVIDATLANMKQNQDVLMNQNTANAIRQGAYGGSGQFMGMAEIARQQALSNAQTLAQLNAQNYNQALQQYNQQQQQAIGARQQGAQTMGQLGQAQAQTLANAYTQAAQGMGELGNAQANRGVSAYQGAAGGWGGLGQSQAALNLQATLGSAGGIANLGNQAQQAAMAGLGALSSSGAQQQALGQQQLGTAYDQWQQAKAYPYQQTAYFANLAQGVGPLMGQYGSQAGSSTSNTSGIEYGTKNTQTSGGGGGIPGLITSGLGILSALKDGGVVKDRAHRDLGGPLTRVRELPYGPGPINMSAGLGSLMGKTPFSDAPDNYIEEAEKTSRVMKPARELAAGKLQSDIDRVLGAIPKGKKSSSMDLSESSSEGGSEESGIGDIIKKASGLVKKFDSGVGAASGEPSKGFDFGSVGDSLSDFGSSVGDSFSGLGSSISGIFSADGGRIEKADGGSFADQYAQSQQAQQQAQDVLSQYQNLLGRNAEQGGFDYWTGRAAAGMSPDVMSQYFSASPERMRNVREAYVDYLGRAPEAGGEDYWANRARQGLSFGNLQDFIKNSPESVARNASGSTGTGAVDFRSNLEKALAREKMIDPLAKPMNDYEMMLRRAMVSGPGPQLTPEQQGMPSMPPASYYTTGQYRTPTGSLGSLGSMGEDLGISQSMNLPEKPDLKEGEALPSNYADFVNSIYTNYLGRAPTEAEMGIQLKNLSSGISPAALENALRTSKDASTSVQIGKLYNELLGRAPEEGGLAYWKEQLAKGVPLSKLAGQIKLSKEYQSTPDIFRSNAPVQGYFTNLASNQVNPSTGLFNLQYTAPYRGTTPTYDLTPAVAARQELTDKITKNITDQLAPKAASGGRIGKAAGGGLSGKSLYDYLISIGANSKEAAMLTGNAKVESSFNPYAMHDSNTGYGLWGHGKDRWADMQRYTGQRKPGWEEQAKFALWELRNSPKASLARQALAKADSPQEVAIAGMHYERPQGYRPSTPWAGKNWAQRYSNVASLMGGKDIGAGSVLPRINPNDPSGPLLDTAGPTRVAEAPRHLGLLPRIIKALAPISSAEAAESQPSAKAEEKPMFAWPTLRNPRMNNLPDALGWNQPQAALPEWKKEVQTGFGPLQGEKPADAAQLLAEPSRHEAMGPEMPEEKVVAEDRKEGSKSGKKYWGDWRDAEPWASDPIGGLFDTLTGEEKRADKPGKYEPEQGFDIGSLFGFADGGVVRHAYANGGGEEDFVNPLEELGAAIEEGFGGLFGGEEAPSKVPEKREAPEQQGGLGDILGNLFGGGNEVVAQDREAPAPTQQRGFLPPAVSQALIAAGLGMMASPRSNPFEAIGQGGLQGFQVYTELTDQERKRAEAAAQQRAAEQYQRIISGEPPVAEDTEAAPEKIAAPASAEKPSGEEAAPSKEAPAPKVEVAAEIDVEADPELRRLKSQLNRVASIPAPKGMESVKSSQLSNLRFQIEQRRSELESKVKAAEKAKAAELNTPEAKARAKQLEVEQEALAKEAVGVEQEAKQADQRIATLSRMRDAVSSGKFRTGALAEKELALKKAVQSVFPGAVDEEAIALAEQFDKDALRAVTDATGGKLGAGVSDADVRFLTRQQAGLGTTKAGNVRTLEAAIKIEQRKKDIAQFARDYKKAHNGVLDSGYYQELQQWAEAHPMFVEEKGVKAEDTGKMTPDTVPEGHEIQRGGATYRWDSSSKKYKRVQ